MKIVIVGGGAAGLAAAVAAGRAGAQVTILERNNRVGKKLLLTGNGRCNLSNISVSPDAYNQREFTASVLGKYSCDDIREFFSSMGLWTRSDETGRIYPLSDSSNSVLDVLRLECAALGVEEVCSTEVTALSPSKGGFRVGLREGGSIACDKLIVSTGGGTDILKTAGHAIAPFTPILCPLKTDMTHIKGLSGLRIRCKTTLLRDGRAVASENGEVLFRDYGVSGIEVFDLSRFAEKGMTLRLDLLPDLSEEELADMLNARSKKLKGRDESEYLLGIFHSRIAKAVMARAGSKSTYDLIKTIKAFDIQIQGKADVTKAQVTRGGADVSGFDPETMESLILPGLYAAGEALDVDGRCGGYNLHWAFASGITAGLNAAGGKCCD